MAESVFEIMKASAAESIPRYRQELADLDQQALLSMLALLRSQQPLGSRTQHFLDALASSDTESYRHLSSLDTEDLLELHESIQRCWNQLKSEIQKQAIRQLYQLIAAHFFVYHVKASSHDPAA